MPAGIMRGAAAQQQALSEYFDDLLRALQAQAALARAPRAFLLAPELAASDLGAKTDESLVKLNAAMDRFHVDMQQSIRCLCEPEASVAAERAPDARALALQDGGSGGPQLPEAARAASFAPLAWKRRLAAETEADPKLALAAHAARSDRGAADDVVAEERREVKWNSLECSFVPLERACDGSAFTEALSSADVPESALPHQRKALRESSLLRAAAQWSLRPEWEPLESSEAVQNALRQPSMELRAEKYLAMLQRNHASRVFDDLEALQRAYFVVRPTSPIRMLWDALSLLVIIYDLLFLPLAAFNYSELDISHVLSKFTTVFWSIDLPFNFFVGYHVMGKVEMRLPLIAKRYFKGWFLIDVLVITADWTLLILQGQNSVAKAARAGKTFKLARIFRVFRLLRIFRLQSLLRVGCSFILVDALVTAVTLIKWVIAVGLSCHLLACAWYGVGQLSSKYYQRHWIAELESSFPDASLLHRYLLSVHWSFAQFTGASSPFNPVNTIEEAFSVLLLFCGLVIFSAFLGSVTGTITFAMKKIEARETDNQRFRRYIVLNNVSWHLGNQISHFIDMQKRAEGRVVERDVSALGSLPRSILIELRCEVMAPVLVRHGLFCYLLGYHPSVLKAICCIAASQAVYTNSDEIFESNTEALHLLFVIAGSCDYCHASQIHNHDQHGMEVFKSGDWLCEAALWMHWTHRGVPIALKQCDIVEVDAAQFASVIKRDALAFADASGYAGRFLAAAQRASEELYERLPTDVSASGLLSPSSSLATSSALSLLGGLNLDVWIPDGDALSMVFDADEHWKPFRFNRSRAPLGLNLARESIMEVLQVAAEDDEWMQVDMFMRQEADVHCSPSTLTHAGAGAVGKC
eukprot:TRINITY_DN30203_c0_g1_i1.p1 TRINITY_DN30203_c0_g1~~TRINITY_DN30203_c0_g1_i1.p1  ORF type:complete len:867 (-),score=236.05 TRINITY_DN30203_c0_g1_i1:158-2758(-)